MTDASGCMNFMGRLLNENVRTYAMEHAKSIGLSTPDAYDCVQRMCNQYERDKPFEAQNVSLEYVDLIGHYRIMAAISSAWWEDIGKYE